MKTEVKISNFILNRLGCYMDKIKTETRIFNNVLNILNYSYEDNMDLDTLYIAIDIYNENLYKSLCEEIKQYIEKEDDFFVSDKICKVCFPEYGNIRINNTPKNKEETFKYSVVYQKEVLEQGKIYIKNERSY